MEWAGIDELVQRWQQYVGEFRLFKDNLCFEQLESEHSGQTQQVASSAISMALQMPCTWRDHYLSGRWAQPSL